MSETVMSETVVCQICLCDTFLTREEIDEDIGDLCADCIQVLEDMDPWLPSES